MENISFIAAVNDNEILKQNLLFSGVWKSTLKHEFLKKEGYKSASIAFNTAIDEAKNDLLVFIHQDIYLPEKWDYHLIEIIDEIEANDENWGVLGVYGISVNNNPVGFVYCNGEKKFLGEEGAPVEVQSLDEVVLIMRKSAGLRFDENMPGFHLYATDICLTARELGKKCYAISNVCVHNTLKISVLPKSYWDCFNYVREKWVKYLPVKNPCFEIVRNPIVNYFRRIRRNIGILRAGRMNQERMRLTTPEAVLKKK